MSTIPTIIPDPILDLVLDRVVDVPRELVWAAWTEPKHLTHWFSPRPWMTTHCEIELRPGGAFHTVMTGPNGEVHDSTGCVLEVVPGERFVFTDALLPGFRPSGTAFMTAIITLESHDTGTRYLAMARHADVETTKKHEAMGFHAGWSTALDQLVEYVKTL